MHANIPSSEHLHWDGYQVWRGPADGSWVSAEDQLLAQASLQQRLRTRLARTRDLSWRAISPRQAEMLHLPVLGTRWYVDLALGFLVAAIGLYWSGLVAIETLAYSGGFPWEEVMIGVQAGLIGSLYVYARCRHGLWPAGLSPRP